jgi:hypothetical protein
MTAQVGGFFLSACFRFTFRFVMLTRSGARGWVAAGRVLRVDDSGRIALLLHPLVDDRRVAA